MIGDLNGDDKPDLVVANVNYGSSNVSVLLGNGDGSFGVGTEYGTGNDPISVAIGDLNGDGKQDLAVANHAANTASVLVGNGDGSFGLKTDFGTGVSPSSVAIGDLNGDVKPDLAVASHDANTVSVLLGSGDGSFEVKTDYGTGSGPSSVAIGDMNGDGNPDLAVSNNSSNTVSVLLNLRANTVSVIADLIPALYELAPPYPNPSARTKLSFALPTSAFVRLEIYDVQGRRMKTLQDGILAPGHYTRSWDGTTASGSPARTGVYFVRFWAPGVELARKAILIR
jgi:hypothetical protein